MVLSIPVDTILITMFPFESGDNSRDTFAFGENMPRNELQPGQDTIDSAQINPDPRGGYRMKWSIRLPDGLTLRRDTRGKMTKGELRAKARRQAEDLKATFGQQNCWRSSDLFGDYIKSEAMEAIRESPRIRDTTRERYALCLSIASKALGKYPIADALRAGTFGNALSSIARQHGTATARQVRKVINKWVIQPLILSGALASNPIAGLSFDLPEHKAGNKPDGGKGLTESEWKRVLDWLLSDDWWSILDKDAPKRGKYSRRQLANARRSIVEMTALQAATGLRIGETRALTWNEVGRGCTIVEVTDEASKTHRGRIVPVLEPRVVSMLQRRREACTGQGLVFPSPAADDPWREWDKSNCSKAVRALYEQIAEECGIELLGTVRSHVWRSTLHTIARNKGVPIEMRAALFGHDPETARRYYTDTQDVSGVAELFAPDSE